MVKLNLGKYKELISTPHTPTKSEYRFLKFIFYHKRRQIIGYMYYPNLYISWSTFSLYFDLLNKVILAETQLMEKWILF